LPGQYGDGGFHPTARSTGERPGFTIFDPQGLRAGAVDCVARLHERRGYSLEQHSFNDDHLPEAPFNTRLT
jgi:hypothetical protein